jgi:hypothetical protein
MKKIYLLLFSLGVSFMGYSQILFTDVTTTAGVSFNSDIVESVAWGDYDNDGDQDLLLSTDTQNRLMRNDGGDVFTDVSNTVNLIESFHNTGCVFADFDNDGNLDIYIVSLNGDIDEDLLYRNTGATGGFSFQRVLSSASGIAASGGRNRGMAVLDYNRDGLLDVWVNSSVKDKLYRNNGNFSFTNVSISAGIVESNIIEVGNVPTDINNDGWVDVFTGNRSSVQNSLYINNGDGTFTDNAAAAGINAVGLGMGVLSFDYDNDLDMDFYWTTWPHDVGQTVPAQDFQPNAFYQNQGNLTFTDVTVATGTGDASGWGISANTADINNDGFVDFFVSNGFRATSTQSVLFLNNGGINFSDITTSTFGNITWDARGVAFADYDNDGDLDVVLTGGPNVDTKLWRNDTNTTNNWVTFNLIGTSSQINAIGARVELTAGGLTTVKEVSGGAGRGSFNSLPLEFGLGTASNISKIVVRWPNGDREEFLNFSINQFHTIVEGTGTTLSLKDQQITESLTVYPNPFTDRIQINLQPTETITSIQLFNALGQVVFENFAPQINNREISINTSASGLYFLKVVTENSTFVRKLIKK